MDDWHHSQMGEGGADYLWLSWVRCEVLRVVAKNFRGWPASLKLGYAVSLSQLFKSELDFIDLGIFESGVWKKG